MYDKIVDQNWGGGGMTDWSPPSYATVCMQEELSKALYVTGQK